ncbi:MAG: ABC transporter permease, partial [Sphingobium sp.]
MKVLPWAPSWRIARRDLHAGFRGLRLLFLCLFLGVMTLAGIGSLTSAITCEIGARGQQILGGDIEVAMTQRQIDPTGRAALGQLGQVSDTLRLRAMASRDGESPVLTELKAVDNAYPLYGALTLEQGRYAPPGPDIIFVSRALADRLRLTPGDTLKYGNASFTVRGIVADEPDRVGEGFTLGPVALVSIDGMARTGLIQPGSLYTAKYRVRLPEGADAQALRKGLEKRYGVQGWTLKDRDRAAPGTDRFIENMGQFLSLIGLSALVIAGIGVSNGVASYLAQKRASLATLKILGARASDIERIYLLQIGAVVLAAILSGLLVGALLPLALTSLMGDLLPVQPAFRVHAGALATSAAYGLLIAFIFTLPPLARARTEPAAAILRAHVDPSRRWDRRT